MNKWLLFAGLFWVLVACQQNAVKNELKKPTSQQELTDSLILTLIYGKVEKSKEGCCMRSHNKFFSTVLSDSNFLRLIGKPLMHFKLNITSNILRR